MIKKIFFRIVFVFSLFLLPFGFSFSMDQNFYPDISSTILDGHGNDFELKPGLNFLLNDNFKVFSIYGGGTYPRLKNVFWSEDGLYFIDSCNGGYSCQNINTSIKTQGYIQYYYECPIDDSLCYNNRDTKNISGFLNNRSFSNPDYLIVNDNLWDESALFLCFVYNSLNKQVCLVFGENFGFYSNSLGFTYNPLPSQLGQSEDQISSYFTNSPFSGVSDVPSYDVLEDTYTYGQIVEGYEACGLEVGYCFGGFPLDDIFEPNQSIEDFTGYKFGYGANIFYIYSLYSSQYTPKQFFAQMLQAYNNGQINRFKTEPKALIMFVQQYVSGKDRGLLNVGFYDLWDYCNIKLGYTDLNSEYTGHNQTPKTCYKLNHSNDEDYGGYVFTGDNSYSSIVGTGKIYKNAGDFFGTIGSIFNNGIGSVNTNYTGFIPVYILVFMFAFIFIRLISK